MKVNVSSVGNDTVICSYLYCVDIDSRGLANSLTVQNSSLITPAYTSAEDKGNDYTWENRMDLVSNEHGYLYKKSVHMPFLLSQNIKREIVKQTDSLYEVKYTAYGNFKPFEDIKNITSYDGWWSIEYWFYETYFDYQMSFNFKNDINVEYIKPIQFHLNKSLFTNYYVSPDINGRYDSHNINFTQPLYMGRFDNPRMNFVGYYGDRYILLHYLSETSDTLDYTNYGPYMHSKGPVTGGLYIGFSGQHAVIQDDLLGNGTFNPSRYTTYVRDKTHYWKFRIVPLIADANPIKQIDGIYDNIVKNEYVLYTDNAYDVNILVNDFPLDDFGNNGTFYITNFIKDRNSSWKNDVVIVNPTNMNYKFNMTISRYNNSIKSFNVDIPSHRVINYSFDLWQLSGREKLNYWLYVRAKNVTDQMHLIHLNGKLLTILPKRDDFEDVEWINDNIVVGENILELSGNDINKKILNVSIVKYYYDKRNKVIPVDINYLDNNRITGKFFINLNDK